MKSTNVSASHGLSRLRHVAVVAAAVAALSLAVAPSALAGKPASGPAPNDPYTLTGLCAHTLSFTNTTLKGTEALFDAKRSGAQSYTVRGMGNSLVTDLVTDATYTFKGGFRFAITWAPDGSYRVDGDGADIIAWYYPGDDTELPPGVWDINGHLTEWYAADDTFLRATFSGAATDVCAALGA